MLGISLVSNKVTPQSSDIDKKADKVKKADKNTKTDGIKISKSAEELSKSKMSETSESVVAKANKTNGKMSIFSVKTVKAETTNKSEKADRAKKNNKYPENATKVKEEKLSKMINELKDVGVSSKEIGKTLKDANRKNNESIGKDIKQAYTDYKEKKISADGFKDRLYKSAIKKGDGIASSFKDLYSANVTSSANKSESTSPSSANKEGSVVTQTPRKSIFEKKDNEPAITEKATAKKDELALAEETVAKNNERSKAAKAENTNAEKVFEEVVGMFNEIDNMVNGLGKKLDSTDEKEGFTDFVSGLKDIFGKGNDVEGSGNFSSVNFVL